MCRSTTTKSSSRTTGAPLSALSPSSPAALSIGTANDQTLQPSKASDVYAWACTAFEILSCRLPYHGADGELEARR